MYNDAKIYYGDFSELTKEKAIEVCENLKLGDIIVLDKRVIEGIKGNYKFCGDGFNYTFSIDNLEELLEDLCENGEDAMVVDVNDRVDCSTRLTSGGWISWGMIDYKATAKKNGLEIDGLEESSPTASALMDENDKLKAQIKELKGQIEMMKQSMILSPNEIRGSIWHKEGYNCVVVQTDDDKYMLINTGNYNRYYDESFTKAEIVGRLIEKGWALESKGGN